MQNNRWIHIEIIAPAPAADLLCDRLSTLGCSGTLVEQRELDCFTVPEEEIDPASDLQLQAYFPAEKDLRRLRSEIEEIFEVLRPLFVDRHFSLGKEQLVKQEDWAEGWKQHFSTMRIGRRLIIRPSWEEYSPRPGEKVLQLDPGMAFGTGSHGTTLLCLEAIVALFDQEQGPKSLLDVGTGSGILAMAAAALGADDVLACDIDPLACQVATENCRNNNLGAAIQISSAPLHQLPGRFAVVVANILAEENLRLADQLLDHLAPGGHLFLSGILKEKESLVREGFSRLPLRLLDVRYQDEWVCLSWQRC